MVGDGVGGSEMELGLGVQQFTKNLVHRDSGRRFGFTDTLADILIQIAIYFCFVHTNSAQALDWSLRLRNVHNAITRTL